ncbi:hypothetical protein [Amycolatopsis taiwanensis]|uniref:hypothetical protein n=1 Tax=Amycolatopsis taiwanensis TaxID=342230 RepID=UPI0012EB83A4|nr:hypothetical protein [Amycolatopsis taiwanensis]
MTEPTTVDLPPASLPPRLLTVSRVTTPARPEPSGGWHDGGTTPPGHTGLLPGHGLTPALLPTGAHPPAAATVLPDVFGDNGLQSANPPGPAGTFRLGPFTRPASPTGPEIPFPRHRTLPNRTRPPALPVAPMESSPTTSIVDEPNEPVAQRAIETAEPTKVSEPAVSVHPVSGSATANTVAPAAPQASHTDPEELLKTLYDPLLRRLRTELRLDRERRGALSDLPR